MLTSPAPFFLALGASAVVAFGAWQLRSLTKGGAVAAWAVGCAALSASWGMGCYLIAWFVLASALSRYGKSRKAARVSGVVEKGSQRDAWQVLANGGVFGACALCVVYAKRSGVAETELEMIAMLAAAGSLAAAAADTWATEIGTFYGGAPWSLRTFSRVPAGTSGAMTFVGTAALIAGASVLAMLAFIFGLIPRADLDAGLAMMTVASVALGGVVGAMVDTALGALAQERRWCPRCTSETEQKVHRCGTPTAHHRGLPGLHNDWVNLLCALSGAAATFLPLLFLSLRQ